jgi:hypothetical protein
MVDRRITRRFFAQAVSGATVLVAVVGCASSTPNQAIQQVITYLSPIVGALENEVPQISAVLGSSWINIQSTVSTALTALQAALTTLSGELSASTSVASGTVQGAADDIAAYVGAAIAALQAITQNPIVIKIITVLQDAVKLIPIILQLVNIIAPDVSVSAMLMDRFGVAKVRLGGIANGIVVLTPDEQNAWNLIVQVATQSSMNPRGLMRRFFGFGLIGTPA